MSGHKRHLGKPLLMVLAAVLGASVVVLPAVASSEATPTIEAVKESGLYGGFRWKPPTATISAGGEVTFSNPSSETNHGVQWLTVPATPSCEPKVPVGTTPAASNKAWSGKCTFSQPGTYTFRCTVHEEMKGTITVNATGTTTSTGPTGTTGTTNTQPTSSTTNPSPSNLQSGSPLAGSASSAIKLRSSQHGRTVRGSVDVSQAGVGGRLEVDLLAKSASLARTGHGTQVRVGTLVRSGLKAGKLAFSVPVNSRARRALRRHGRLPLTAKVLVSAPTGVTLSIARSVLIRP
jgi:plastocyanin